MSDKDRFIGKEIKILSNQIKRASRMNCKFDCDEEITASNGWLMMYLYDHRDEDVFQKDIEYEFSIRRSTSSSIISLMEKKGYIERVSVAHDARLKKLVLTDKALRFCDIIQANTIEFEDTMRKGITDEELEFFYSILDKIVNNIKLYNKE